MSLQFSCCDIFNFAFVFIPLLSPLPLNATLPAMLYFQHFLTSPPSIHFPHLSCPSSRLLSGLSPFPLSPPPFHAPPSVDSLHRSSFLCYFNPLRFSSSHHHIHSSIPQLLALRTSAIINLVQPQELGHWGTLEHVTLKWGPNPLPENCLIHACEQNHTLRAPTHTPLDTHTHVLRMPGL